MSTLAAPAEPTTPEEASAPMAAVEVLRTGMGTTVQDAGRHGHAHLGIGRSGAADAASYALANRLVANPDGAAALEVVLGGLRLRARGAVTVAVTGAPCPVTVDGRGAAVDTVLHLPDGAELELGIPATGLRSYVAVRGGIDVAPVLGSRSTDTLAGLGPPVPRPGAVLPVGPPPRALPAADWVAHPPVGPPGWTCGWCWGRAPTGSPTRPWRCCCTPSTRSPRAATGSARGWPGPPWSAASTANCPARGWCRGRCRSRRTATRCCSSPTIR